MKRILVIDDEEIIRNSICDYLEDFGYIVNKAENGQQGVQFFSRDVYDAVLVDLSMPVMDGFGFVEEATKINPQIPIIVISGVGQIDEVMRVIHIGASDFLQKPMKSFQVLSLTLERVLEKSELVRKNKEYRAQLEQRVEDQISRIMSLQHQLISTQKEVIFRLGDVIEARSGETGYHVQRVAESAGLLGRLLGLNDEMVENLISAAPMHDIGKIGIEDAILNKPGRLTVEEMAIMKTHAQIGYDIMSGSKLPMLQLAGEIALNHHEKWDGTGYPKGLSGEAIPISARITTITDVFDAISHARIYKPAWSLEESFKFMQDQSEKIFDPKLVKLFLKNKEDFLLIRSKLEPTN